MGEQNHEIRHEIRLEPESGPWDTFWGKLGVELRNNQKKLVVQVLEALGSGTCNSALCIAPTGAGKTVMLSVLAGVLSGQGRGPVLVLQNKTEILDQNLRTFQKVCGSLSPRCGIVRAHKKQWGEDFVFGMVQTMDEHRDKIPSFGLCIVDEAHAVAAPEYHRVLNAVRERNPDIPLVGFTATPKRGDGKPLTPWFDHITAQIMLGELLVWRNLCPPHTKVIANDAQKRSIEQAKQLNKEKKEIKNKEKEKKEKEKEGNWSKEEEEELQVRKFSLAGIEPEEFYVPDEEVFKAWEEHASDRKTVFFAPGVQQSVELANYFRERKVPAWHVDGGVSRTERMRILREFDEIQEGGAVLCNVKVLTEGWDCPSVTCIGLTRNCSHKGTYIQIVGRGLRPHPGKTECLVLDFGTSTLTHGNLEADVEGLFDAVEKKQTEEKSKPSGETGQETLGTRNPQAVTITDIEMVYFDVLGSLFKWRKLYDFFHGSGERLYAVACCLQGAAFVWDKGNGIFEAGGYISKTKISWEEESYHFLGLGSKNECFALADDFITKKTAGSGRATSPHFAQPTESQKKEIARLYAKIPSQALLTKDGNPVDSNRYGASCLISGAYAFRLKKKQGLA